MSTQALCLLSALVIVTLASACDNVKWEPATLELAPPPSKSPEESVVEVIPSEPDFGLPTGPVLYMGTRDANEVTLSPVAEIRGDSLHAFAPRGAEGAVAFARDHLIAGSELILFAEGVRVGRMRIESVQTDSSYCTPRPAVSGVAELVPSAASAERFLALAADVARTREYVAFEAVEHSYAQRSASVNLSAAVIPEVGARWPEGTWQSYRVDMRAFQPGADAEPAFASTFLFRDTPQVGPADTTSYAIFMMGQAESGAYRPAHTWYRPAGADNKGIPLFFGHLDWDEDGQSEVLLEVLGERSRWVAALNQQGGRWVRIFEDPCGSSGESPGA